MADGFTIGTDVYLRDMRRKGPRQVCQYQFRKNDIVWICKTCQQDDTCVQCNECYQAADHSGHEVFFYHSQAGGVCDCGDSSSWAPEGFCTRHGKVVSDPLVDLSKDLISVGSTMLGVLVSNISDFCKKYVDQHDVNSYHEAFDTRAEDEEGVWHAILHNDDVHTFDEVINGMERVGMDRHIGRGIADSVHSTGSHCVKSGSFYEVYPVAKILCDQGLKVSIVKSEENEKGDAILSSVTWLFKLAQISDGLCRLVCTAFSFQQLIELLKYDPYYSQPLARGLHVMYLTLMADQGFKVMVSKAYAMAFSTFAHLFSRGIGVQET